PLLIVVFTLRKYIDKKSIKSIGFKFKYKAKDIGLGFLFALIIIGGGAGLIQYLGFIDISFNQFNFAQVLVGFCLFFIVSISEEILFRGYILNNLLDSMNKYVALIISALIFSSFHGLNSNLTKIGFANLFLAGVLLGSAYVFIKNLWFSISLHLFWNFIQGSILGFSVSGLKIESLFDVKNTGDKIFSGGEFGFEGSLLCTLFTAISILIILMYFIFENKRKLTKSRIEILV
ncbi:MAG TPA: CPBP family intramembrane glutamic endopeptidase, partial [Prolixibacteraceae bacterium]|nr:CPBP family intramembrane glutamic endopeptidase [Prolixibacteraceae bacterium]